MYSHFINIYVALILEKILYSSLADNLLHTTSFEKENEVSFSAIPHLDNTPKVCVCVCVCVCFSTNSFGSTWTHKRASGVPHWMVSWSPSSFLTPLFNVPIQCFQPTSQKSDYSPSPFKKRLLTGTRDTERKGDTTVNQHIHGLTTHLNNMHGLRMSQIFPGGSDSKVSAYNAGDLGSIPGSGRSPGEGNGKPLQDSCLGNLMDRGAW